MGDRYTFSDCFRDYWYFLEDKKSRFAFWAVVKAITDTAPFLVAYLLGRLVDFFTDYAGGSLQEFYIIVAIMGIAGSLQVWLRFHSKLEMLKIAADMRRRTRVQAMSHMMDLELEWHEKEETGSKIQKINNGGESIYEGTRLFINKGLNIASGIIGSFLLFIFLSWKYALFAFGFIAVYLAGEFYFNRRLTVWEDKLNRIKEKVSGKLHESASNLLTVKSLGLKNVFTQSTHSLEKQYYDTWYKTREIVQAKLKTVKIFSSLVAALFLLMIGFDTLAGVITVGSIIVYASYFTKLKLSLHEITHEINRFIRVKSSIGRFMTILGVNTKDREAKHLGVMPKKWRKIEFFNITFRYGAKPVLQDFNLQIKRREKIGIVGRSGSGKSTLVKLLLGLYQQEKGDIKVDGVPLTGLKHSSITRNIGIVLQDSEMFNMSLLDNLTISSIKKDSKSLQRAVRCAQLEPLIKKLPYGLNTLIGERGYKVSGGERQRIGIARAIYKNSSLIILDEATSNLDSKTENLIQQGLEKFLNDKTLIVIAHRLSTLKNVDRIIVMHKGRIVEEGTFKQLIGKKGRFFKFYRLQNKK